MAVPVKPFNIQAMLVTAIRRKWYIIVPCGISLLISLAVYKISPRIYRATTVLLIQSQTVPENYVRSTVTDSLVVRINAMSKEVLSRTTLEKVIAEFNLYPEIRNKISMDDIIEKMRKATEISIQSLSQAERTLNSFSISYEGKEPTAVMRVTNHLASLFMKENVRVRELQAQRTSEFLQKELDGMEAKLKKKEVETRTIKEKYAGQFPQQLEVNLSILDRLQVTLQSTTQSLSALEDKMVFVQDQIENLRDRARLKSPYDRANENLSEELKDTPPEDPMLTRWASLKREYEEMEHRYTGAHPDVIALKKKIEDLEPKARTLLENHKAISETRLRDPRLQRGREDSLSRLDPATERLLARYEEQLNEGRLEAKRLKTEEDNLKSQIAVYQRRIEETPKREQELAALTRDDDLLRASYLSLLDKKIQAQMAENLERKQEGEQFRVLEPARVPETPIKPDVKKILLIGAFAGLAAGIGLAKIRESLDHSLHTMTDVEVYLGVPVTVGIPNLKEDRRRDRVQGRLDGSNL